MLLLLETPTGFALFKVLDEGKLSKVEDLSKEFAIVDTARKQRKNVQKIFYQALSPKESALHNQTIDVKFKAESIDGSASKEENTLEE